MGGEAKQRLKNICYICYIVKALIIRFLIHQVHYVGREVKEETKPPFLRVQICDKDRFSGDDLIGKLDVAFNM